jgi:hypothetical protein
MKRLIQVLCSLFFATTMTVPVDALANSIEDRTDATEERAVEPATSDNYHLALVSGDFGLPLASTDSGSHTGSPLIFITDPAGKIVKNALVVTTLVGEDGEQLMNRACPFKSGYLVFTNHLMPGRYRVEAEVVTDGMLLTREFQFVNT